MQEVYRLVTLGLAQFDQGVHHAVAYLDGGNGPIGLVGYLVPLLVVLLSRQLLPAAITLVLAVAALAAFRLNEPALGLALYAASYVAAAQGFVVARTRQRAAEAAAEMARLRLEVTTFLDALDRRSRGMDRVAPQAAPAPQAETASEPAREDAAA